jgi:phage baseplate assembly protein W
MLNEFLGTGWSFPITLDDKQHLAMTPGEDAVRQSIWMILSTAPGERVMRPGFGCGLHDLVFGVNSPGTANAVAGAVKDALAAWEPRIDVLDVFAAPDATDPNLLLIEINYQVRSTNSRFNLVYPFYLG